MTGLSSGHDDSGRGKPLHKLETLVRETGKGIIRALYRVWAQTYDSMLVRRLGYHAPQLAANALASELADDADTVLDVGCGTGLTAQALLDLREVTIDGIDFSSEMLKRAREKNIYRDLMRSDVTKPLPVPDRTYDAAISSGLFTHGHVGANALPHILKAIRTDGLFAFTVNLKIWESGGFDKALDGLTAKGEIEVLSHVQESQYRIIKGQPVHTLVVRVTA